MQYSDGHFVSLSTHTCENGTNRGLYVQQLMSRYSMHVKSAVRIYALQEMEVHTVITTINKQKKIFFKSKKYVLE